jgi:hypothetical protein
MKLAKGRQWPATCPLTEIEAKRLFDGMVIPKIAQALEDSVADLTAPRGSPHRSLLETPTWKRAEGLTRNAGLSDEGFIRVLTAIDRGGDQKQRVVQVLEAATLDGVTDGGQGMLILKHFWLMRYRAKDLGDSLEKLKNAGITGPVTEDEN